LFDDARYTGIQEISPSSSVYYNVSLEREINIQREVTTVCKEYEGTIPRVHDSVSRFTT